MSDQSQISATVSAATKERLDRFTERLVESLEAPAPPTQRLRELMRGQHR